MDFVPDEAEPWICQVQNVNDPEDGACVQADGSGDDGSGDNCVPPAGVPDPWNGLSSQDVRASAGRGRSHASDTSFTRLQP